MAPGGRAARVRIGIGIGSEWSKISNSCIDMRMLLGVGGNQILFRFALPALGRLCFLEGLGSPTQPWPAVLLLLSLSLLAHHLLLPILAAAISLLPLAARASSARPGSPCSPLWENKATRHMRSCSLLLSSLLHTTPVHHTVLRSLHSTVATYWVSQERSRETETCPTAFAYYMASCFLFYSVRSVVF